MKTYAYEQDDLSEEEPTSQVCLLTSFDEKTMTLVCRSNVILSCVDYANTLREFANHIEGMARIDPNKIN